MYQLDRIDLKILDELQKDSKQSVKSLAEKVGLSITPVHERIKRMENTGVIQKYVAVADPKALGKRLIAYCQVEKYISGLDEVLEASYMAGGYDFLLKVILNDMEDYQKFVVQKLSKMEIISNIQSSFVIQQIKNTSLIKSINEETEKN